MRNLAGETGCDSMIAIELAQAQIEVIRSTAIGGEVASTLRGCLGPILFLRRWIYWTSDGPVPLAAALELYEHPLGRREIRVLGNCMRPPPDAAHVSWYTSDGVRVFPKSEESGYKHACEVWPHIFKAAPPTIFDDDPKSVHASAFVDLYHIDSIEALALFANALRKHGIEHAVRPVWWKQHHPESE